MDNIRQGRSKQLPPAAASRLECHSTRPARPPPPPVKFEEFDGLTRILFSRRNKTVRSSFFNAKGVVEMLERNYKTWCSETDTVRDFVSVQRTAAKTLRRLYQTDLDMKKYIDEIFEETGYSEERAAKMDINDLLK